MCNVAFDQLFKSYKLVICVSGFGEANPLVRDEARELPGANIEEVDNHRPGEFSRHNLAPFITALVLQAFKDVVCSSTQQLLKRSEQGEFLEGEGEKEWWQSRASMHVTLLSRVTVTYTHCRAAATRSFECTLLVDDLIYGLVWSRSFHPNSVCIFFCPEYRSEGTPQISLRRPKNGPNIHESSIAPPLFLKSGLLAIAFRPFM